MKYLLIFLLFSLTLFAQDEKTSFEKEQEVLDFNNLEKVLKNDQLEKQFEKKKQVVKSISKERIEQDKSRFNYPTKEDFWGFLTQLWLVKNAPDLKWDITKPEYGIEVTFKRILEGLGLYEKTFRILLSNSVEIAHMGLPLDANDHVYLVSIPFIRAMDLSKVEISLLMIEDYLRLEMNYLKNSVSLKEGVLGENFSGKKIPKDFLTDALTKYNESITKKGFSFQQQFEVTKRMKTLIFSDQNLYKAYISLLKKIKSLMTSNKAFENYLKLYPSPQMQLGWLGVQNIDE